MVIDPQQLNGLIVEIKHISPNLNMPKTYRAAHSLPGAFRTGQLQQKIIEHRRLCAPGLHFQRTKVQMRRTGSILHPLGSHFPALLQ